MPIRRFVIAAFACLSACQFEDFDDPTALVPATVDEDASLPALDINGTRLHLEVSGPEDGPLVVLLHGGPGDDFRYIEPLTGVVDGWSLADAHQVVLFDQRGSGLSRRHDHVSLADYLDDLRAVIDHFAPGEPVILIGHSWGGMYAAMYMNQHPERVAGAVLLEPGGLDFEHQTDDTNFDLTAEWLNDFAWGRQVFSMRDHAQADYYLNVGALADIQPERNDTFSPWWRFGARVKIDLILGELLEPYDFTQRLGDVPVEVLFIVGGATTDLGAAHQATQLEFFAAASLEVVEDAGHADLTWSRADDSLRLIRDYLARVEVSP